MENTREIKRHGDISPSSQLCPQGQQDCAGDGWGTNPEQTVSDFL